MDWLKNDQITPNQKQNIEEEVKERIRKTVRTARM